MAKIGTGVGGTVTFATGYVLYSDTWALSGEGDEHDVTDFTSTGWKNWLIGLKEWEGTYEGWVDDTTQLDAAVDWFAGAAPAMTATFDIDWTRTLTGLIYIKGFTVNTSVSDPTTVTFNFRGDDALAVPQFPLAI